MTNDKPRLRLEFLDGLRGLAALYVVVFHTSQVVVGYANGDYHAAGVWHAAALRALIRAVFFVVLAHGHYAVDVFIVLSGFCLMLPIARAHRDDLPDSFTAFMSRRARRILPPYFAAVIASLALIALVPGMNRPDVGNYWSSSLPAFGAGTLLTHALLIHNLGSWATRINGPLWSVAAEWQIYFLFPLLLLPLRRRVGSLFTALIAFALGVCVFHVAKHFTDVKYLYPWFLGLFAFGMFAASVAFSARPRETRWNDSLPWGFLTAGFTLIALGLTALQRKSWDRFHWIRLFREDGWGSSWPLDLVVGLAVTFGILALARNIRRIEHNPGLALRLLESKFAIGLGAFSYSLYLVHVPIIGLVDLSAARISPVSAAMLHTFFTVPAALAAAYGFYRLFEKPWLTRRNPPAAVLRETARSRNLNLWRLIHFVGSNNVQNPGCRLQPASERLLDRPVNSSGGSMRD